MDGRITNPPELGGTEISSYPELDGVASRGSAAAMSSQRWLVRWHGIYGCVMLDIRCEVGAR